MSDVTLADNRHEQEQSLASKKLAESAKRIQDILDKINVYKYKAEMLESVTGIPFINEQTMLKCLKNQKNSSKILNKQSQQKKQEVMRLKKMLAEHKQELHDLMYNEEWRLLKRIEEVKEELSNVVEDCETLEGKLKRQKHHQYSLEEYLVAMAIYLKQASCALPHVTFNLNNIKDVGIEEVFNEMLRVFFVLYNDIVTKLNHSDPTSQFQLDNFIIRKRDINKLIPEHNNRIKCQIERRASEEFGEYNQPSNDAYLSREAIKARAEIKKGR